MARRSIFPKKDIWRIKSARRNLIIVVPQRILVAIVSPSLSFFVSLAWWEIKFFMRMGTHIKVIWCDVYVCYHHLILTGGMIKPSNWRTVQVVCFSAQRGASIDRSEPCSPRERMFAASPRTDDSKTCVGEMRVCVGCKFADQCIEELLTVIHQEPHLYAFVLKVFKTRYKWSPSFPLLILPELFDSLILLWIIPSKMCC